MPLASTPVPVPSSPPDSARPLVMAGGLAVLLLAGFALWWSLAGSDVPAQSADGAGATPSVTSPQTQAAPQAPPLNQSAPNAAGNDAQQRAARIEEGLANARSLLASGRYDEASRAAADVLALEPGNAEAKRVMDEGAAGSRGKGAEEARTRMDRAKNAANAAAARTFAAAPYAAALAAERDAASLYKRGRAADAMAKFWEATGLFTSAEVAARTEAAARTERARVAAAERKPADTATRQEAAPPPKAAPQAPQSPIPPIPTTTGLPLPNVPAPEVPPAPKPSTPPPATADAPLPPASPTAGIPEVLDRYKAALENRSLEALKRLWPSLGGAQESAIRGEFQNASRIEVEIVNPQTALRGNTATVTFVRRYQLQTIDRQRLRTETRTTMRLQRSGSTWIIDQMTFEPVR